MTTALTIEALNEDLLGWLAVTGLDWVAMALAARTCSAWRKAFAKLLYEAQWSLGGLSFQLLGLPPPEAALHSPAVLALLLHAEATLSNKTDRPLLGSIQDSTIYLFVMLRRALQTNGGHATVVVSSRIAELVVTSLLRIAQLSGCSGRLTVIQMPQPESRSVGAKDALRPLLESRCVPDAFFDARGFFVANVELLAREQQLRALSTLRLPHGSEAPRFEVGLGGHMGELYHILPKL